MPMAEPILMRTDWGYAGFWQDLQINKKTLPESPGNVFVLTVLFILVGIDVGKNPFVYSAYKGISVWCKVSAPEVLGLRIN